MLEVKAHVGGADRPDLWTVRTATSNSLSINHIAHTPGGPHIPDWYTASRLVSALHGRPADFRALWHTAAQTPTPAYAAPEFTLPAGAFGQPRTALPAEPRGRNRAPHTVGLPSAFAVCFCGTSCATASWPSSLLSAQPA